MLNYSNNTMSSQTEEASETVSTIRTIRFGLEGALLGVASYGLFAWVTQFPQGRLADILAAAIGFVTVIVTRLAHSR
jgi:uncharacterized membrane protein YeaQ/YmgE (transglycosylase-associated protein family)